MKYLKFSILAIIVLACNSSQETTSIQPDQIIEESSLRNHIRVLASDDFQGRMPFTEGEEKTINYLKNEFEKLGLKPGNGDSFFQEVPLVEIDGTVSEPMTIAGYNGDLTYKENYVALTRRVTENIKVDNAEMVFAGFGVVAPEYNWNDYEGLEVAGKVVVVLVNDPGFGTGDESFFKGDAMTYYGRWTYKYEEAARQGAAGVLVVHDTEPAGYPWGVVRNGWTGANLYLQSENNNMDRCAFEGWISKDVAEGLFSATGKEEYDFTNEARSRDFEGFSLGLNLSIGLENKIKSSTSNNVAALYEGADRSDEIIIYSAHWDHMGVGEPVDGDSIWNGAIDNASGTAALIEIAKAFSSLPQKTSRSVLFLAVTAEEQGLLGSAHYAENPIYPVTKTVANINMDALRANGLMKDLTVIGHGQSDLDTYAEEEAKAQGRYIVPDMDPGKGYFFRSDHFNFAKVGIPALYAKGGHDHHTGGTELAKELENDYRNNRYHKPADEYSEDWDLGGMIQDAQLLFNIGLKLANETTFPKWKEGSEFKAKRDADMAISDE